MTDLLAEATDSGFPPAPQIPGIAFEILAPDALILLGGDASDPAFAAALDKALGLALPPPGRLSGDDPALSWAGPGRWLLWCGKAGSGAEALAALETAFEGKTPASEVTDGFCALEISGPRLRDLLSMGTSLDVAADALPAGGVAITRFAELTATLLAPAPERVNLLIERASRHYLWSWLLSAVEDLEATRPDS